jgi:hypothetical protein
MAGGYGLVSPRALSLSTIVVTRSSTTRMRRARRSRSATAFGKWLVEELLTRGEVDVFFVLADVLDEIGIR